jgi:peptidyl-prolyl isomerase H (cyclophilin H)
MSIPEPPAGHVRPVVFFDITIGDAPAGRIKMGGCS